MKLIYLIKKHILTPMMRSIRKKLLFVTVLVTCIPLLMAVLISWHNNKDAMEQVILHQNASKISWVEEDVAADLHRIDEALTAFFFDSDIQFYTDKLENGDKWQSQSVTFFHNKLKSYLLANFTDFEDVSYYSIESNQQITVSIEDDFNKGTIDQEGWIFNRLLSGDKGLFYSIHEEEGQEVIEGPYMIKRYLQFENQKVLGGIAVHLSWNIFDRAADLLGTEAESLVLFYNRDGQVIYKNRYTGFDGDQVHSLYESAIESGQSLVEWSGYYAFTGTLSEDLYVVKLLPTSVGDAYYRQTLFSQLGLIGVVGLLVLAISYFLSVRLTNPLTKLTDSMHHVEDLLDSDDLPKSVVKSNDEIKMLEQSYHFMIQKIKNLIDKEYKQQLEKQNAQLMALQSQMNPHFLYNTLNMIGAMAVEKEAMEIYEVTNAFSKMTRYNMSCTDQLVDLATELTNTDQYLQIQKKRFGDKIEVEYAIEPGLDHYKVPKLILQPLVENCFKHGFKTSKSIWHIWIDASVVQDTLFLIVRDNGVGISEAVLEKMQVETVAYSKNIAFDRQEHLGLSNIQARIRLHDGPAYGITLKNEEGLEVILKMKAIKEDTHD